VDRPERIWVRLPFSIYLGWVSVAVIANAAAALVSLGWDGGGAAVPLTCLMAAAAAALGGAMLIRQRNWAYAAVIICVNHYTGRDFLRTVPERILRSAPHCKS
jgi:hypothetical protein